MSELIHLWRSNPSRAITKCGIEPKWTKINALWASTAEKLRIPPSAVCKNCYRLGPPWLVVVK